MLQTEPAAAATEATTSTPTRQLTASHASGGNSSATHASGGKSSSGSLGSSLSSSTGALPSLEAFNFQSLFASGDPKARISNIKKIGEG
jgi:hypothetical protein